jgi:hypothetical protein
MNPLRTLLAFAVALLFCAAHTIHAQTPNAASQATPSAQTPPAAPAKPAAAPVCIDSKTLDDLVKALDDAVSGPADKDRACLKALLEPGATLSPIQKTAGGAAGPHSLTVDAWIETVKKRGATFYEHQVKYSADQFGHLAHLWSTYEITSAPDSKALVRGVNSIQAVFDGTRWRVASILFLAESSDEKVPAKYLPLRP